jgi:serine phosphatase RsbU (regulator of sigma subunit)
MIARLFIYIYNRTSFTFAIAIFTTTWSWVASFYGFFFVYATVNFKKEELLYLLSVLVICTGLAIFFHLSHFGMFHRFGFSGFSKTIRRINKYFDHKYIFINYKTIESREIENVYAAISSLPSRNLFTGLLYTTLVILSLVIIMFIYSGEFEKVLFILIGGIFASAVIGYFTFLLTEYLTGPYKMRLEQMLFERAIQVEARNLLSFKYKAINILMLTLFSMINLTILIRRSEKTLMEIIFFIGLSLISVGLLIFLMLNILELSLQTINRSTKKLALGGNGMFFPPFSDKEFTTFSINYNLAAVEINEIRTDLEKKITERTEELSNAYESLNKAYGQIQADLTLAKRIQKRIMPEDFDSIQGLDLVVHYYPMADIGGDIYDIFQLQPGCIRVFLADAIGHGIQAALITMIIKGEYEKVKTIENTQDVLKWLNKSFTDLYISLNAFFSCILLDIDIKNKKIRYASAGHPDQIHINENSVKFLKHTGKLIGIKSDTEYGFIERDIKAHDKILLYTDGLFEQFNEHDDGFTEQHIIALAETYKAAPIRELDNAVINSLREFMGGREVLSVRDDITLISIEINGK